MYATAYERPKDGLLLFVSHLWDKDTDARVTLEWGTLGWTGGVQVWDALSDQVLSLEGRSLRLPLKKWEYRVIRLKPL